MEYRMQNPITPTDLCHIETVSPKAADDDTNYADNFTGFEEPNRNEARSILIAAPEEAAFDPDATMQEIPKAPKELSVKEVTTQSLNF